MIVESVRWLLFLHKTLQCWTITKISDTNDQKSIEFDAENEFDTNLRVKLKKKVKRQACSNVCSACDTTAIYFTAARSVNSTVFHQKCAQNHLFISFSHVIKIGKYQFDYKHQRPIKITTPFSNFNEARYFAQKPQNLKVLKNTFCCNKKLKNILFIMKYIACKENFCGMQECAATREDESRCGEMMPLVLLLAYGGFTLSFLKIIL